MIKIKAILTFCTGLCFLHGLVHGQIHQPNRLEFNIEEGEEHYEAVAAGQDGLLLFRERPHAFDHKNRHWEIVMYDTALNQSWQQAFMVKASYNYVGNRIRGGRFFMLFSKANANNRLLELVIVNLSSGQVYTQTIRNAIPFALSGFEVTPKAILVNGYHNYRPIVFYYDFANRSPRVLAGMYDDRRELLQIKVNENNFDVVLVGVSYDKRTTLFLKTYDHDGNLTKNTILNTQRSKGLIFGKARKHGERQLVAGVYGLRNSEYSRGVFVTSIDDVGDHKVNFYNYGDFQNFFNYMRDRRERRVRGRIARRKTKNKKLRFNYRLLVHEIQRKQRAVRITR